MASGKTLSNNKIQELTVMAASELFFSFNDLEDLTDFPLVVEEVVRKCFHVDWVAMFNDSPDLPLIQVTTNPHLPFNWNDLYGEIARYDKLREYMYSLTPGQVGIYEPEKDLNIESVRYCLEFIKKHTDTTQFMSLLALKQKESILCYSFYRSEKNLPFISEESQIINNLAPTIITISKNMSLYVENNLKRVALDYLLEKQGIMALVFDTNLRLIEMPYTTELFLKTALKTSKTGKILEPFRKWIYNVAPSGKIEANTGPWEKTFAFNGLRTLCSAHVVTTETKKALLLIQLEEHGKPEDFSVLESVGLTKREIEALEYLPLGYTNRQIAKAMGIREVSVKKHLRNTAHKLHATGRTEILYQALKIKKEISLLSRLNDGH